MRICEKVCEEDLQYKQIAFDVPTRKIRAAFTGLTFANSPQQDVFAFPDWSGLENLCFADHPGAEHATSLP
eukprot:749242-Hanusia_phi.AAC.5